MTRVLAFLVSSDTCTSSVHYAVNLMLLGVGPKFLMQLRGGPIAVIGYQGVRFMYRRV